MPVDRAFVLKGHGVIVTGTAAGGSIAAGDDVTIEPSSVSARVREVQVHERAVERAFAGQRVALNLSGVDRDVVARGDTVVAGGVQAHTDRFDARVEIRPAAGKSVASHTRVRVHLGTRESVGRIVWLDGVDAVAPRASGFAQLVLRGPAVAFAGDRFVLRDETASRTLGGGVVVVARARKHRTAEGAVAPTLRVLEEGGPAERAHALLATLPGLAATPAEVALELGWDPAAVVRLCESDPDLVVFRDGSMELIAARARAEALDGAVVDAVHAHHRSNPNLAGVELEPLRARVGRDVEPRLFRYLVDRLVGQGRLVRRGSIVAAPGHRVRLNDADEALAERVCAAIRSAAAMPPTFKQLEDDLGVPPRRIADVIAVLGERGAIVKVAADMAFSREAIDDIAARLRAHLEREREITAAGFRDLIDASRKYSIPLLDYFDRSGLTVRAGDLRRLRDR
jgi:selenocysteine-specific elongation factor